MACVAFGFVNTLLCIAINYLLVQTSLDDKINITCLLNFIRLMEDVTDPTWFAVGVFTLRTVLGICYAAYTTAIFAVVTTLFQARMGFVLV